MRVINSTSWCSNPGASPELQCMQSQHCHTLLANITSMYNSVESSHVQNMEIVVRTELGGWRSCWIHQPESTTSTKVLVPPAPIRPIRQSLRPGTMLKRASSVSPLKQVLANGVVLLHLHAHCLVSNVR